MKAKQTFFVIMHNGPHPNGYAGTRGVSYISNANPGDIKDAIMNAYNLDDRTFENVLNTVMSESFSGLGVLGEHDGVNTSVATDFATTEDLNEFDELSMGIAYYGAGDDTIRGRDSHETALQKFDRIADAVIDLWDPNNN